MPTRHFPNIKYQLTIMLWGVAKKPFFIQLAGLGVMLIGVA
ncbi:MAG: hypothetical protein ACJAZP_001508 [Psychromonas sp.]|jgi:hypothetical protein